MPETYRYNLSSGLYERYADGIFTVPPDVLVRTMEQFMDSNWETLSLAVPFEEGALFMLNAEEMPTPASPRRIDVMKRDAPELRDAAAAYQWGSKGFTQLYRQATRTRFARLDFD